MVNFINFKRKLESIYFDRSCQNRELCKWGILEYCRNGRGVTYSHRLLLFFYTENSARKENEKRRIWRISAQRDNLITNKTFSVRDFCGKSRRLIFPRITMKPQNSLVTF